MCNCFKCFKQQTVDGINCSLMIFKPTIFPPEILPCVLPICECGLSGISNEIESVTLSSFSNLEQSSKKFLFETFLIPKNKSKYH